MGVSWRKPSVYVPSSDGSGGWARVRWLLPLLPIAVFLICWQVLSDANLISRSLFAAPTQVIDELVALHFRELPTRSLLLSHVVATLKRLLVASFIGILSGTLGGVFIGTRRGLYRFFDPLITFFMPIPGIALAPLFIIWLGFGDPTIIAVGSIAAFFPLIYNTAAGVRSIDPQLVRAAHIMGASRTAVLFDVYLPWAAGHVLLGVKLGLARCWRTIVAVEFVAAASWGLGYMIWDAAEYLRAGGVYGGIALLVVIYLVIEKGLVNTLEKYTVEKWGIVRR
jgi:ABC-type nitrate/sulfonate/bicarbonate transport system permease component